MTEKSPLLPEGAQRVKKIPNTRVIPNQCRSTGVGIPRMNVEITGLGTKMFELPGDCDRRESL